MNIEVYGQLHEPMEIPSQGTGSSFRELLKKMFEVVFRLIREATRGVNYVRRVVDNGSYTESYKSEGVTKPYGNSTWLVSYVPMPFDTPLYQNTFKRGQRNSEVLLNASAKLYIGGVSTRDNVKMFDQFGIESMSSTQMSNTIKKLDEGSEPQRNRDLGEFRYLILIAGYQKLRRIGIVSDVAVLTTVGVDWQSSCSDPLTISVFSISQNYVRDMRPPKLIERAVNQKIKRRTRAMKKFPHKVSLLRLITSI